MPLKRIYRTAIAATLTAAVVTAVAMAVPGTAETSNVTPLDDQAAMAAACTARLADPRPLTPAQRTWLDTCQAVFAAATTPPSASPSSSPRPSTPPTRPSTSPAPPPAAGSCPAWPAFPDGNCTGWRHTGVTLRPCSNTLSTEGATYDSCRFTGTVVIAASNITIKRSHVDGGHVEGASGSADLRGLQLIDVEISGPVGGNDFYAAIGNNRYSCLRCDIHGGLRGLGLGNNVTIVDSYVHDQRVQAGAHQTAASTHGGAHVRIEHSTLRCNSDRYACSNGVSFYSEDAPGIDDMVITRSHLSTDAGYCIGFFSRQPGKPHGITNTRIIDNVLGSSEYGPVANWPAAQNGNVWSGNTTPDGVPIKP